LADPFAQGGETGGLGMEYIDIAPKLVGPTHQRCVTADGIHALTYERDLGVRSGRQCRPDQATAPVINYVATAVTR